MRVLGIVGSPRRGGNTDVLVGEVLRGAASHGAHVQTVYLNDLNIRGCQACEACKGGNGYVGCIQDDDMLGLYDDLIAADAIVIGTPIYYFGPSAQTKLFLDRWYSLHYKQDGRRHNKLTGKQMVLAMPYGDDNPFFAGAPNAYGTFRDAAAWCGMKIAAVLQATANKPGEIRENQRVMQEAYDAGKSLAAAGPTP
ncbi:MAG TPA: flavodoxin family protein [Symbiobacteriaceae bacterium]|nr:flavodoxin family protein [Symbiobacteriaceae bacterium]